ncbi:amidohydrolase [Blastococcus sp. MG754426]|uniref:amidohydrolase family protein n=1 Tax=unclassified Blastococcus TaxID=2619396 RepID=UPI001EEF8B9B|nr:MULTISPECIES: amidohydrolase family protein [unclassified Blastococcus]MCF6508735.1 amidohydrolase [Blastococcus sp. MG754426]MCF6513369.1 amidohydrolase [Blastococcus sp. MG754427]MCF6734565.1 amidohydrolase [Blastococcus sp. KM273129]
MAVQPPVDDGDVPRYWRELGLPGLVDVHVHVLPERVQAKVWQYFEAAGTHYGAEWPVAYRLPEEERLAILARLGVRAFPTLPYPHKPGMAAWLNEWSAGFAAGRPQVLQSATFYPEPGVAGYVAEALDRGARVFKVHVQVGAFDPRDRLLDDVWARLEETGTPVVIHCGSGPLAGEHTGPAPMTGLLERFPRLQLVIAHLGMPEYREFLGLAERYERVHLDTTMFATDFTERLMPFDRADLPRLGALRDKVLLGSDFPSIPYPYAHQLAALHRLGLGEEWLRAVLWRNGARLFTIEA